MAHVDVQAIIPHTTMQKYVNSNNVEVSYYITPEPGYVLHDTAYGSVEYDDENNIIGVTPGYRTTTASVGINYDFTAYEMQDENGNTVVAYGSRQFFTKLRTEVPEDQIYSGDDPKPELM